MPSHACRQLVSISQRRGINPTVRELHGNVTHVRTYARTYARIHAALAAHEWARVLYTRARAGREREALGRMRCVCVCVLASRLTINDDKGITSTTTMLVQRRRRRQRQQRDVPLSGGSNGRSTRGATRAISGAIHGKLSRTRVAHCE